jgi:hypothetical protein
MPRGKTLATRENTWSPIHSGTSRDHRVKRGDMMPWILRLIARTASSCGCCVRVGLVCPCSLVSPSRAGGPAGRHRPPVSPPRRRHDRRFVRPESACGAARLRNRRLFDGSLVEHDSSAGPWTQRHVRVGVLEPGAVGTELRSRNNERMQTELLEHFNMQHRRLDAEDTAEGIEFMVTRPRHASIASLWVMPTDQI